MSEPYLKLYHLKNVDSTSTEVTRKVNEGHQGPFCVLADQQSAGRGRLGRSWLGLDGNFFASFYQNAPSTTLEPSSLSVVAAVAAAKALHECFGIHISIKWPNDLYLGAKKLGGILIECTGNVRNRWNLNIGIGINLSQAPCSENLDYDATSLDHYVECSVLQDPNGKERLARSFWEHWTQSLALNWTSLLESGRPFGLKSHPLWRHKESRDLWVQSEIHQDGSLALRLQGSSTSCRVSSAEHTFELLKSTHTSRNKKKLLLDIGNTALKLAYVDRLNAIHSLATFKSLEHLLNSLDDHFQTTFSGCFFM